MTSTLPRTESTCSEPQASVENDPLICDIPYYASSLYVHNENAYGRKQVSEWKPPTLTPNDELYHPEKPLSEKEIDEALEQFWRLATQIGIVGDAFEALAEFLSDEAVRFYALGLYRESKLGPCLPRDPRFSFYPNFSVKPEQQIFFSKEFVLPDVACRRFDPRRPIGVFLANTLTMAVIDQDYNARQIMRGNIVGLKIYKTRVHKLQALMYCKELLTELFATGETWSRGVSYRCDGTVMVALHRIRRLSTSYVVTVEMQDITDQYFLYL